MRFESMRTSALDRLADALRRADATWFGDEIVEWDRLAESEREEWRVIAREAATTVFEEISDAGPRARALGRRGSADPDHA